MLKLKNPVFFYTGLNDEIEILSTFGISVACKSKTSPKGDQLNVDAFRKQVIDEKLPRQRFVVSRKDGIGGVKCYWALTAKPSDEDPDFETHCQY